jgi:tRNA pseudouridine38-40 synthase
MPSRFFKGILEYDGSDFHGFQIQPEGFRTVQGEITQAISEITDQPVKVIGASRTDAGVHAMGQVVSFETSAIRTIPELLKGINSKSPGDWKLLGLIEVSKDFHPRYDAKSKTYIYMIDRLDSVLRRRMSWGITEKLNNVDMQKGADLFRGEHDFRSFTLPSAHEGESTVRRMDEIKVEDLDDLIIISITGSGFLYQMVRRMVGILVKVGKGEFGISEVAELIENPQFNKTGITAPPGGLILKKVHY